MSEKFPELKPYKYDDNNRATNEVLFRLTNHNAKIDLLNRAHMALYESMKEDTCIRMAWLEIYEFDPQGRLIRAVMESMDWGLTHCSHVRDLAEVTFVAGVKLGQKLAECKKVWTWDESLMHPVPLCTHMNNILEEVHRRLFPNNE